MNNNRVSATSVVHVTVTEYGGAGLPFATVSTIGAGSCNMVINNAHSADALNAGLEIAFSVV